MILRGDRCMHAVCCRAKNWIHLDDGRLSLLQPRSFRSLAIMRRNTKSCVGELQNWGEKWVERDWELHWGREKKYRPHLNFIFRWSSHKWSSVTNCFMWRVLKRHLCWLEAVFLLRTALKVLKYEKHNRAGYQLLGFWFKLILIASCWF